MEGDRPLQNEEHLPSYRENANMNPRFPMDMEFSFSGSAVDSAQKQELDKAKWLDSAKHWKKQVGDGWVPQKVLGRGGQGIVGHWKYMGNDPNKKRIADLVVKQSALRYQGDVGLMREANFLSMLVSQPITMDSVFSPSLNQQTPVSLRLESNKRMKAQAPHILNMYGGLITDEGKGTMDYDRGIVHRIYLELCLTDVDALSAKAIRLA